MIQGEIEIHKFYILLFSKDIAVFVSKHLIVISKSLILKGSFNLKE